VSSPVAPGSAPAGRNGSGYLLGSVLLVWPGVQQQPAVGVTVDSLMLSQREAPQPAGLDQWYADLVGTLARIGWVTTRTSSQELSLGKAGWLHRTAEPWSQIQPALPGGAATAGAASAVLGQVSRMSATNRDRWVAATALRSAGVVGFAQGAWTTDGIALDLTVATLTYPDGARESISGFPTTPVPVSGARLQLLTSGHQLAADRVPALQSQLDPLVNPVRSTIVTITY
jgi:hypothetical protein